MYKLPRSGKRVQTSAVQYRVQRSSAKHETVARGIKIECEARDLSSRRRPLFLAMTSYRDRILGSGESAPLSISSETKENLGGRHAAAGIVAVTPCRLNTLRYCKIRYACGHVQHDEKGENISRRMLQVRRKIFTSSSARS